MELAEVLTHAIKTACTAFEKTLERNGSGKAVSNLSYWLR